MEHGSVLNLRLCPATQIRERPFWGSFKELTALKHLLRLLLTFVYVLVFGFIMCHYSRVYIAASVYVL